MEALRVPWPVQKRFNSDHEQRGRSKPGCREEVSLIIARLVTDVIVSSLSTVSSCLQETNPTSASEVTTLWRYTNVFIIIIIIMGCRD